MERGRTRQSRAAGPSGSAEQDPAGRDAAGRYYYYYYYYYYHYYYAGRVGPGKARRAWAGWKRGLILGQWHDQSFSTARKPQTFVLSSKERTKEILFKPKRAVDGWLVSGLIVRPRALFVHGCRAMVRRIVVFVKPFHARLVLE